MWPKYSLISDTGDMQNKDKACERADEKEKPNWNFICLVGVFFLFVMFFFFCGFGSKESAGKQNTADSE